MCLIKKNSNFLFCGAEVRFHPANLDHQFFRVTEDPLAIMNLAAPEEFFMPHICFMYITSLVACSKHGDAHQKCKLEFE
jgi:hypothetical protein